MIHTIQSFAKYIIATFTIIACGICANLTYAEPLDKVVAIVNDDIITKTELDARQRIILTRIHPDAQLPPQHILEKQILHKVILEKLQLQLAKKQDISVDSNAITNAIKNVVANENTTQAEMNSNLKQLGVTNEHFRNYIKNELVIAELQQREVGIETTVTESEVESFVNSPVGQDLSGTKYLLGHILLSFPENATSEDIKGLENIAYEVMKKLKHGDDFNKVAMAKSSGIKALEGGDLGWRTIGQIPSMFVKYVTSMNVHDIRGPVKSSSGYHIIKLKEKQVGKEKLHKEIHARQILLTPNEKLSTKVAKKQLEQIRKKLMSGADFMKFAHEKSNELGSKSRGGDLGWVNQSTVLPRFFNKISKLNINEISEPFETEIGWHLVQVLGVRNNNTSLAAARNRARAILHDKKFNEKLELWLKHLKASAKIETFMQN